MLLVHVKRRKLRWFGHAVRVTAARQTRVKIEGEKPEEGQHRMYPSV